MITTKSRPPPRILYVSNLQVRGADGHHVQYLKNAGLIVAEANANGAVTAALSFQPDVIVLDFEFDGDIVAALQRVPETAGIPVIALAKLMQAPS